MTEPARRPRKPTGKPSSAAAKARAKARREQAKAVREYQAALRLWRQEEAARRRIELGWAAAWVVCWQVMMRPGGMTGPTAWFWTFWVTAGPAMLMQQVGAITALRRRWRAK